MIDPKKLIVLFSHCLALVDPLLKKKITQVKLSCPQDSMLVAPGFDFEQMPIVFLKSSKAADSYNDVVDISESGYQGVMKGFERYKILGGIKFPEQGKDG